MILQLFSNLVIIHLLAHEDGTESVSKRRHIKFRRRGNYPEENIQQSETKFRTKRQVLFRLNYWLSLLFVTTPHGFRSPSGFVLGTWRKLLAAEMVSKSDTLTERTATNEGRLRIDSILPRGVIQAHRSKFTYICYSYNKPKEVH